MREEKRRVGGLRRCKVNKEEEGGGGWCGEERGM